VWAYSVPVVRCSVIGYDLLMGIYSVSTMNFIVLHMAI